MAFYTSIMKKLVAMSEVASLRRKIMSLASMMLMLVLSVGIVGLFSVWSLSRFHTATQHATTQVAETIEQARQAQTHFKTQVQEWKNILLRGHDLEERKRYSAAFETQALRALELLESLPAQFDQVASSDMIQGMTQDDVKLALVTGLPRLRSEVTSITAELRQLNQTYRNSLAMAQAGGKWDVRYADSAVRGADRELSDRIDAVMVDLMKAHGEFIASGTRAELMRFDTLSRFVWISILSALGLLFFMLWQTLRHPVLVK